MALLELTDEHAQLGKISNNLEHAGEDKAAVTGFTLPLRLRIARAQLIGFMGEEFDRAVWLQTSAGGDIVAAPWARRLLPFALDGETYVGVKSAIVLGGQLEPANGQELTFDDCRVSKVTLVALAPGGITEIHCHLYVRPGIGLENLALQEYQEREIAVQMTSGKLRVKADKAQQELPLNEPSVPPATSTTHDTPEDAEQEGEAAFAGEDTDPIAAIELEEVIGTPEPGDTVLVKGAGDLDGPYVVGTPEQEREKAHAREREIAQQLHDAHHNGNDDPEMSRMGRQIQASARRRAQS
jgi:hypothetical protein